MKKINRLINEYFSLESSLFRYSLSYCLLLALLPGIFIILILFQYSIIDVGSLLDFLFRYVPRDLIIPFIEYVMNKEYHSMIAVMIAMMVPCFVASKAIYSFLLISAKKECFDTFRVLIRIQSVGIFFLLLAEVIALTVLSTLLNLDAMLTFATGLWFVLWMFYRMLSFERQPLFYGGIGAFIGSIAIIVIGQLFYYVIDNFTSYQSMYGPLSSLVVLFLAVYVVSCIIYFGFCLTIVYPIAKRKKRYKNGWYFQTGEEVILWLQSIIKKWRRKNASKD